MENPPYFIYPAVKALRATPPPSPEEAQRLRRLIAANVGDIPSLRIILNLDPEEFGSFYPDMALPNMSTNDTIDTFLSHFGNPDAPTPMAADMIKNQQDISHLQTTQSPLTKKPEPQDEEAEPSEEDMRTAVKKHEYQKALQIIERLNLIYPEKSIYFADQIRFLRKIILIQNSSNN